MNVGLIPDGNRRWCAQNVKHIHDLIFRYIAMFSTHWLPFLDSLREFHISKLYIYLLSHDNLTKRSYDTSLKVVSDVMSWMVMLLHIPREVDVTRNASDTHHDITVDVPFNEWKTMQAEAEKYQLFTGWKVIFDDEPLDPQTKYIRVRGMPNTTRWRIDIDDINTYETLKSSLPILAKFKQNVQINVIGELHLLPTHITYMCNKIHHLTQGSHATLCVYIALAYDPEKDITRQLKLPNELRRPPIDLVVRTSGERRSSGFFPLETMYSEWYYEDKLFPDWKLRDFVKALHEFQGRERRFGA